MDRVPQPAVERIVPPSSQPLVVAVRPGQPELVLRTAAVWAEALSATLVCGYVDPHRMVVAELADGSVRHTAVDPDLADDAWQRTDATLRAQLAAVLDPLGVRWEFRYLAGRADRALTHLARAVDASAIIVGSRHPVAAERLRDLLEGSVALGLTRHQHRPVITVPVGVVDWKHPLR